MSPLTVSILSVLAPSPLGRTPEILPLTVAAVPPNSSTCSSSPETLPLVEVNVRLCVSTSSSSRSPLVVSVPMLPAETSSRSMYPLVECSVSAPVSYRAAPVFCSGGRYHSAWSSAAKHRRISARFCGERGVSRR